MKTRLYIDFDGVIQETWSIILKNYESKYNTNIINDRDLKQSMLDIGWNYILNKSNEINNSFQKISILNKEYDVYILTKVNSIEEKKAKKIFLNQKNITNIIFVPYNLPKTDFVDSNNCILIDDEIKNLEEWSKQGGISILFNKEMKNIDSYGNKSDKYIIIDDLLKICDIMETDRRS